MTAALARRTEDDFAREMAARRCEGAGEHELHDATHGDSEDEIIRRGVAAAARLTAGQNYADWIAVGEALWIGHSYAKQRANNDRGRRYTTAFHEWMVPRGLDKIGLDGPTRAGLLRVIEHRNEIEAWRSRLPLNEQLEINHPRVVLARWKKAVTLPDPNKQPKPSPIAKLKESVAALSEENQRLKDASGGSTFTGQDRARDIANVLLGTCSPNKLRDVCKLVLAELKEQSR